MGGRGEGGAARVSVHRKQREKRSPKLLVSEPRRERCNGEDAELILSPVSPNSAVLRSCFSDALKLLSCGSARIHPCVPVRGGAARLRPLPAGGGTGR